MADYLLDLSRNPFAKKLVRQLKLPIPLPEPLRRATGAWDAEELQGAAIAVGSARGGRLGDTLQKIVTGAGAEAHATYSPETPLNALLFDATGLQTAADLGALYDFVKPRLKALTPCARVVLVGLAPEAAKSPEHAAAAAALAGFVKSLSKEIGRKGSTANVLTVDADAQDEARLAWPVAWLLSARSAFVSGQVIPVTGLAAAPDKRAPLVKALDGKVALVTGAAQGIGAATCRRLAEEGAKVVGLDRPKEREALDALAKETGGLAWTVDLLDPHAAKQVATKVETELGHLDLLVNNAGITRDKTLARMPRDWWDDTLAINLAAAIALTEALVNGESHLIKLLNPEGRVVFLSSVGGIAGNLGQTNYAAAKAGLLGYVRALAPKVAAKGITVNALAPGFIETRMTKAMPVGVREVARRFNALSQAGVPDDVAEAAVFLAAPGAYGITGATLRVCGHNLIGA